MIFNMVAGDGGSSYELPVLNEAYPQDVSLIEGASGSATFMVVIDTPGKPAEYVYQWYVDNEAVSGATEPSYTPSGLIEAGTYIIYCEVANKAGIVVSRVATLTVQKGLPGYTYSGDHQLIDDGAGNWRIKFLTSGTLEVSDFGSAVNGIDVFLVGGGGGGCNFNASKGGGAGGGGGYTKTDSLIPVLGEPYEIIIGAGGAAPSSNGYTGKDGGQTSAFGFVVDGGKGGVQYKGGDGGSGGGSGGDKAYAGGYDGGNGASRSTEWPGGTGQGTTTREFGETGATLYAGGGAGSDSNGTMTAAGGEGGGGASGSAASEGEVNTGGGGGGGSYTGGKGGGSGIVIIRNKR